MPALFGHADADAFLARHWQKAAAFLKNALPDPPQVGDWRKHAAREDVECRRIATHDDGRFALEHGPLEGADPHEPWTVLIQDADHHWPALRALIDAVDFLPRWRVEDVMMSVATRGGSVGPHVDAYDVFLVQAAGERRWEIGARGDYQVDDREQDLRLVEPFTVTDSFTARPGDVLYLPPDVPHHGVALNDCVTYSIGFRAPTLHDLAAVALGGLSGAQRYGDADATRVTETAQIDALTLKRLRTQLQQFLTLDDATLASALGELMTEPKPWLVQEAGEPPTLHSAAAPLAIRLAQGARVAWFDQGASSQFFANGQAYAVDWTACAPWLTQLANQRATVCPADAHSLALAQALLDDQVIELQP